jgi:3',5'-cyclic AMP phosphodiesterase CpdA
MTRISFLLTPALLAGALSGQELTLPNKKGSFHFAVIGDTGTGERPAVEIATRLAEVRAKFPFDLVVMLGDNMYGGQKPKDYKKKFEDPYKPLLDAGVKFHAALGNHDDPNQKSYKLFNMNGERFYTFKPRDGIRFFALDSNYMDKAQLEWLEKELAASGSDWKIAFFHHPLYSSGGKHGSDLQLRAVLEPLFVKHQVSLVLAGHDHFYERVKPQRGIVHFVIGGSAKLREGNVRKSDFTAKSFDTDRSFALMEIDGDNLHFQAIRRTGETIDSGTIAKLPGGKAVSTATAK